VLKFQNCFPGASAVIRRPGLTLLVAGGLSFLAWPLGTVFMLAPLCLWTLLGSLFLERRLLDALIFPPFTSTIFMPALGTGIGLPALVLLYGHPESVEAYSAVQFAHLFAFPCAWFGYRATFGPVEDLVPGLDGSSASSCPLLRPFALGWLALAILLFLTKVLLGWEGRGAPLPSLNPAGLFFFEPAKLLNLFPLFIDAPFFFVRFLGSAKFGTRQQAVLGALLAAYFFAALGTGSRGDLIYPMLFILAGCFFFRVKDSVRFEKIGLCLLFCFLVIGWIGLNIRSFYLLQGIDSRRPDLRLFSLREFIATPEPRGRHAAVATFFTSLYPWYDSRVFARTPKEIPHAGWEGWQAILYTPVPHLLMPNKPSLFDMETIYQRYCSEAQLQYHAHRGEPAGSGSILSIQADAYRRFGWWGIAPVLAASYALFGILTRWMLTLGGGRSLFHWGLLAMVVTFIKGKPMVSLLTTWWSFAYFWPKHLIVLFLLCLTFQFLYPRRFRFRKEPNQAGNGARTLPPV